MAKPLSPMPRFRFSLLALFGFVAFVAVACAALVRPTMLWVIFIRGVMFASLFFAVLAAVHGQRASRAFWVGFAVVGWGYLGAQQFVTAAAWITARLQELIHPIQVPTNQVEIFAFQQIAGWLWPLLFGFIGGLVAVYLRRERLPQN